MKFTKYNREGLAKLDYFVNTCAIGDIQIRQTSNSMRVFAKGRTRFAGEFDIEVRSGSVAHGCSMMAVLGHKIAEHEDKVLKDSPTWPK